MEEGLSASEVQELTTLIAPAAIEMLYGKTEQPASSTASGSAAEPAPLAAAEEALPDIAERAQGEVPAAQDQLQGKHSCYSTARALNAVSSLHAHFPSAARSRLQACLNGCLHMLHIDGVVQALTVCICHCWACK